MHEENKYCDACKIKLITCSLKKDIYFSPYNYWRSTQSGDVVVSTVIEFFPTEIGLEEGYPHSTIFKNAISNAFGFLSLIHI